MNHSEIKEAIYEAFEEIEARNELKKFIKWELLKAINEDKWITVHPNGEDEKGRPLLIKDGETPKQAMQRQWGVYEKRKANYEKKNKTAKKETDKLKDLQDQMLKLSKEYYTKVKENSFKDNEKQELRDKISKLGKELDTEKKNYIAGVKRGEPMSFQEANEGKVNPHYSKSIKYQRNCQSCVPTFEARLRGFNIQAKPLDEMNIYQQRLMIEPERAYIDTKTGQAPKPIKTKVNTPKACYDWLQENLEENARYSFIFKPKGSKPREGHVLQVYKNGDKIEFYDPQSGQKHSANLLNQIQYKGKTYGLPIDYSPKVFRTDDKELNIEYLNNVCEKILDTE